MMASGQSLSDLLNFSLPPRQSQQYQSLPRRKKPGTHPAVWNREREFYCSYVTLPLLTRLLGFVNAQYRFVMNPSGDYTVHFADPDMYVEIALSPYNFSHRLQLLPMA